MFYRAILLLLAVSVATSRAAIDLAPTPHEYTNEGYTFKELLFKDGKRQINYLLPNQWSYRPAGNGVLLTPPKSINAEAVILATPLAKPEVLDEKGMAAAKERVLSSLPSGSQTIKVVQEEQNPVLLDNKPSYEVTVSYQVMGETFLRSQLFTNNGDSQVSFRFTARKSDFEALHNTFRCSLLSWQWTGPETATAPVAVAKEP
jgi:hypothetical protein